MDAILVTEASIQPSGHHPYDHFNDPNWPDSDTPTPRGTDISLESTAYSTTRSSDKIDAVSISAPSSKDYDFDQCAFASAFSLSPNPCDRLRNSPTAIFLLLGLWRMTPHMLRCELPFQTWTTPVCLSIPSGCKAIPVPSSVGGPHSCCLAPPFRWFLGLFFTVAISGLNQFFSFRCESAARPPPSSYIHCQHRLLITLTLIQILP